MNTNEKWENTMLSQLVRVSDERYKKSKCKSCSYKKHCPHDCGECLKYIHFPNKAPAPRKYDCRRMCDYYVCKYSHKYTSELFYALNCFSELKNLDTLKVLSIGCGPCTDLMALDLLQHEQAYNFKFLEYRGIEIDTHIWQKIHDDISQIVPENYSLEIISADACDYVDMLLSQNWKPDIIIFQYVFSDMQKHSDGSKIDHLIECIGKYIAQCDTNISIVCNDINLSQKYNGGRDYFDMLLKKIPCQTQYIQCHFNNSNKKGHYEYGKEYKSNALVFPVPPYLFEYQPYTSCSSAQIFIKKVINDDN